MQSLGLHILMEFYDCSAEVLNNSAELEKLMNEAATKAKATIIKSVFHEFSPQGVTGVVVVAESHLAIHTWPEHNYAAVDFFTCNNAMDYNTAMQHLIAGLRSLRTEQKLVERGEALTTTLTT